MSYIPCSLDCAYQSDGVCSMNFPSKISLENEKCPHFIEKEGKPKPKNTDA
ncbi:MAG: hypothetical protein ACI39F_04770 [Acutalibacteraceae bacterium]